MTGKDTNTAMNDQRHDHDPDRPGARRARSRWWAVGLAGMTGLALTTTLGIGGAPAIGAVDGTLTAADDRRGKPDRASTDNKDHEGKAKKDKRRSTPVPCSADALIAAITLANARGGAVLDLAKDCTYLLTAAQNGAGLPAITSPVTLNGKNTTITRAAAAPLFRIITVDIGGNLTLNHLKVTGGQTTPADPGGGGILVNTGGTATINHNTITGNIAIFGGGISNNGTTTVKHSTISHNTATLSAGGGIQSTGLLKVTHSQVDANNSRTSGGGIAVVGGTFGIAHSTITANQSAQDGGGLVASPGAGTVTDTRIMQNTARFGGGAFFGVGGGPFTLRNVTVAGNAATDGGGGGLGVNPNTPLVIEDSTIKNNTAIFGGGGILQQGNTVLRRTEVTGNQAGSEGGGIDNDAAGTLTLFSTKVVKNTAVTDGGGIFNVVGGTVELNTATGTTVAKNRPNNCVNVTGCPG
ncbi:membrane protein [Salinispora mooreana]|uniref:membrane protein n=1 Tax=Salinispora mooreana TaxID=999545 RepID=UPI00036103DD|nr:membrane protein [Salinispora mooreana]